MPKVKIEKSVWDQHFSSAYQTILREFLLPTYIYYGVVVCLHVVFETPLNIAILGTLAATTSIAAYVLRRILLKSQLGLVRLELSTVAIYLLVYANILVHHLLHLEPQKLIYFVFIALAVATSAVTWRVILPLCLLSLGTAIWMAGYAEPGVQGQFAFIGLASMFLSFGMASLMRSALKREISSRLSTEELRQKAEYAADHDALTGLPNRRDFFTKLDDAFSLDQKGAPLTLGVLDLNGFKAVNDLYGHSFGDDLLKNVGDRILEQCGTDLDVFRMGGDEFTFLAQRTLTVEEMQDLGGRLSACISATFSIQGSQIAISAAVGFATRTQNDSVPNQLYEHADYALYRAKAQREKILVIFQDDHASDLAEIKNVEFHLRNADWENEMHVVFQPQVHLPTNKTIGFEALARWRNPELGEVSPDIFIRAAERSGVIAAITLILFKKALNSASSWPEDIRLSFNLSARDVSMRASVEKICELVHESGFPGNRIDFEITETSIMTDFEGVRRSLRTLQALGAHIALDDFGVGYSNFEHIDELSIQKLKIDRRFISRLGQGGNTDKIVRTIINMCAAMDMKCVVEGVETKTEFDIVRAAGGEIVQGYCFSKPMPANDVAAFVEQPTEPHFFKENLVDIVPAERAKRSA